MKEIISTDLIAKVHDLQHEPTQVMSMTLDLLEEAVVDQKAFVLDPSQPLPFLIENDVVLTAAAIESYEANTIRQYPVMAQSDEDLFLHLSDVDMLDVFSSPGETDFTFLISKAEFIQVAVEIDNSRSRKITIPKHTQILINGVYFTMQYPIDIVIKSHGGIEVSYDGRVSSPIQPLSGTKIDWVIRAFGTEVQGIGPNEYICIRVPVKQMRLTSYKETSSSVSLLKKTYAFEDKFYCARVFMQEGGEWHEVKTTHSDHTFDPYDVTVQLKVTDNQLVVELPYVYQATGAASSMFRIDIYTTLGDFYQDFSGLSGGRETKFLDLDGDDNGRYTSRVSLLETFSTIATGAVDGGSDGMTFDERRRRMLTNNLGATNKPISPGQVDSVIENLGFDVVLNVDDVIGRTYQVSRSMPTHQYGLTTSPIDSAVMTAKSTIENLVQYQTVRDNYEQITVMPETLYKDVDGVLMIVPDQERITLENMRGDFKVNALSTNRYLFTPLHYVLDLSGNRIVSRPYYLTNPTMEVAGYSDSNDTIDLFVEADPSNTFIEYTKDGYLITLKTVSNEPYKAVADGQCFVQLAFKPDVENEWVYANGVLLATGEDGERIWQFRIDTNWVMREDHQLELTNFTMRADEPQIHDTPLNGEWFILWGVTDYEIDGLSPSGVDESLGRHLLPATAVGIYRETIQIRLGDELTGLWRRARPMIGTMSYRKYAQDIPLLWAENIYERDVDGKPIIIEEDGKRKLKILHAKGTPVINEVTGQPELQFRRGDAVRDEWGELIPENPRTIQYWWDVVLFDAQYLYVTRELDIDYVQTVAGVLVDWINDTLQPIKDMSLERTEFQFHPRNSLKYVPVIADEGRHISVYTAQRLVVDIFMDDQSFRETELREVLTTTVKTVLNERLAQTTVSKDDIIHGLMEAMGEDVVAVSITGLGGEDYKILTLLDKTTRLCIAKTLSVESDGTLSVKDDVTINFKRHGL